MKAQERSTRSSMWNNDMTGRVRLIAMKLAARIARVERSIARRLPVERVIAPHVRACVEHLTRVLYADPERHAGEIALIEQVTGRPMCECGSGER